MGSNIEFQGHIMTKVNGFRIEMKPGALDQKVFLKVSHQASGRMVDSQVFDFHDPADMAAAFAKFSNCITWAVVQTLEEQRTSGM